MRALWFASSSQAPRHAGIWPHLRIIVKQYRLCGGEGGIRTPETLSSLHAFQACALNRARPPLRARTAIMHQAHLRSQFTQTARSSFTLDTTVVILAAYRSVDERVSESSRLQWQ